MQCRHNRGQCLSHSWLGKPNKKCRSSLVHGATSCQMPWFPASPALTMPLFIVNFGISSCFFRQGGNKDINHCRLNTTELHCRNSNVVTARGCSLLLKWVFWPETSAWMNPSFETNLSLHVCYKYHLMSEISGCKTEMRESFCYRSEKNRISVFLHIWDVAAK